MSRASAWIIAAIALAVGATGASALQAFATGQRAGDSVRAPSDLEVTNPRICAAEAVYRLATADDWGLRAAIAKVTLNGYQERRSVPDCAEGVEGALTTDFSPRRWQDALDAVDAVMAGDYVVFPDACARANAIVPLSVALEQSANAAPSAAGRAQCVIYNLAFVEVPR